VHVALTQAPLVWLREVRSAPGRQNLAYDLRRWMRGRPSLPPGPVRRVLVICHGNICRSPFAAARLAAKAPALDVRGAGLAAGEGNPAEPGARRVARQLGVDLDAHRSRPIDAAAIAWADLIIGMEGRHVRAVAARSPEAAAKTFILGEFLDRPPYLIPDPWGRPDPIFLETFQRIEEATDALVASVARHDEAC